MAFVVGIDIGSTTTKVALLDATGVVHTDIAATGVNSRHTVAALLAAALAATGRSAGEAEFVATTGYGRRRVPFADHVVSEISANAAGAHWLTRGREPVHTIVDIGGQDSKAIGLDDEGHTRDFAMNDKCAAGTGRFLELMSRVLEVEVDELGPLSLRAEAPCAINSVCAVFAESEVVSLLAEGQSVANIVAGVHQSIAKRAAALARRVGLRPAIFFDGGPARNAGLVAALETALGQPVVVPDCPQVATAIGAAVLAEQQRQRKGRGQGLDLDVLRCP